MSFQISEDGKTPRMEMTLAWSKSAMRIWEFSGKDTAIPVLTTRRHGIHPPKKYRKPSVSYKFGVWAHIIVESRQSDNKPKY